MKKANNKIPRRVSIWIAFVVLAIYTISLLMPIYFMVVNSFKTNAQFFIKPWKLPQGFYFANYVEAFSMKSFGVGLPQMLFNSIIYTFFATVIGIAAVVVTSYILARYRFFGRSILVGIAMASLLIPDLGTAAVIYNLFVKLKMINTWFILIKNAAPFGFAFLIMYAYFKNISPAYAEAARIDGASEGRVFVQIFLPMAKGSIGVIAVMSAIGNWNDYYTPYLFLPDVKTLSLGLHEMAMSASTYSNYTQLFAAMIITTIPLIVVFVIMHDKIITNTVTGGLKG